MKTSPNPRVRAPQSPRVSWVVAEDQPSPAFQGSRREEPGVGKASPGIKLLVPGLSHTNSTASPLGRVCVSLGNSFVSGMFSCVMKGQMNTALCLSPPTGAEGWRVCPPRGRRAAYSDEAPLNTKVASEARQLPPQQSPTLFKLSDSTSGRREWMWRTQKGPSVA